MYAGGGAVERRIRRGNGKGVEMEGGVAIVSSEPEFKNIWKDNFSREDLISQVIYNRAPTVSLLGLRAI
jgi:hypothetical protein